MSETNHEYTTTLNFSNDNINNYNDNENITTTIDENFYENITFYEEIIINRVIFNEWFILTYIIVLSFIGIIGNLSTIYFFCRQKITGMFAILLQIACVDIIHISLLAYPELMSLNNHEWIFNGHLCPLFMGIEIISDTSVTYLIILINLHILTVWNLNIRNAEKILEDTNNPLTSNNTYDILPKKKSVNINTKKDLKPVRNKLTLSIFLPVFIIWILAISLSIPVFTLSTTVLTANNSTICTIIDIEQHSTLQMTLCLFRVILPHCILCFTLLNIIMKLFMRKKINMIDNQCKINMKNLNIRNILLFGTFLTITYILFTLPKTIHIIEHVLATRFTIEISEKLKIPPLNSLVATQKVNLLISLFYYPLPTFRFVLYFMLTDIKSNLKKMFSKKSIVNSIDS